MKNVLINSFVDYYFYKYLGSYLLHCVVNRHDVRLVNTHMKLTGKSFLEELKIFISDFEEYDRKYDFALDHYDEFKNGVYDGIPLNKF